MPVDELIEIPVISEVTQEDAQRDPSLLGDESKSQEGVLDDEVDAAEFEARELQATESIVLSSDEEDEAGGAGPGISARQQRALALAISQKGMRENPQGSNDNIYSRYFGFGPQFWCADFIAYCVDKASNGNHKVPWGYPSAVRNITAWGQRNNLIHSMPMKGDIFTLKDGSHTGFVTSAQGSSFMTIEGNTGGPGGGGDVYVAAHARDASDGKYFFVRSDLHDG
jgi:CHAP domain